MYRIKIMHSKDAARGKRFRSIRRCVGESQTAFGARFRVTPMTISNYEKGRMPANRVLEGLCGMGFSLDWLLAGKGFMITEDHLFAGFIHCCDMLLADQEVGIEIICDGKRIYVNDAMERLTGYAADELMGHSLGSLSLSAEKKRIVQLYETLISSKKGTGHDIITIRQRNGKIKKVKACYGLFHYEEKKAVIVLARDITDTDAPEINLDHIQTSLNNKQRSLLGLFNTLLVNL